MAFPKIEHPIYEIYVKSLDRKVKFRPFLVKEEKILLMAKESKDVEEIKRAVLQIIANCCTEDIDAASLPLFDIEMLFINLRARSVGESIKLTFNCQNIIDEENNTPCNTNTDYLLNLNNVKYVVEEGHNQTIKFSDTFGIKLTYPNMSTFVMGNDINDYDAALQIIVQNIEYIFNGDDITKAKDMESKDLLEFLDNLTIEQMEKIQEFFKSSPKVVLEDTIKCSKCGYEHKVEAGNLFSFFM